MWRRVKFFFRKYSRKERGREVLFIAWRKVVRF